MRGSEGILGTGCDESKMTAVLLLLASALLGNIWYTQGLAIPFTKAPGNPTFVALGKTAELEWNFPIDDNFKRVDFHYEKSPGNFEYLVWKTKDGSVTTHPSAPSNLTSRVSIEDTATLVIKDVRAEDAIRYQCTYVYSTGGNSQETPVKLELSEPPSNVTCVPKIQRIKPNGTATFKCTADGLPPPVLDWYNDYGERVEGKPGVEIDNSSIGTSIITIWKAEPVYIGDYTCKAKNIAGEGSVSAFLKVESCEARGEQPQNSSYCVNIGYNYTLWCPLYGLPQPEIVWVYPNQTNQTIRSKNTLYVKVMNDGDFGKYGCSGCEKTYTFELKICTLPPSDTPSGITTTEIVLCFFTSLFGTTSCVLGACLCKEKKKKKDDSQQSCVETIDLNKRQEQT